MKRNAANQLPALRRNLAAAGNTAGVAAIDREAKAGAPKPKAPRGMNRWEKRYADKLRLEAAAGRVSWWGYERVTLKLADDCRYTPDFAALVTAGDDRMTFVEVKGFKREDAIIKFRVAAEQNPWADFVMVAWEDGGWVAVMEYRAGERLPGGSS